MPSTTLSDKIDEINGNTTLIDGSIQEHMSAKSQNLMLYAGDAAMQEELARITAFEREKALLRLDERSAEEGDL
jgi:hypothetical protein